MLLIDRYIFIRFAVNFAILFSLLFLFAVAIDLILNLDKFVDAAEAVAGHEGSMVAFIAGFLRLAVNFQAPRVFQFYAYLHGLVAIGAMAFTLAQMHRHRELVAVMASGVSLRRVAMPFILAMFALGIGQLLNQELLLPRVAPLLLRGYGDLGQEGIEDFEVAFTPDGAGNLFQAPQFNPRTLTLTSPTILERDERGRTMRRITAATATWSEADDAWLLKDGKAIRLQSGNSSDRNSGTVMSTEPASAFPTDLTPHTLLVRRYNQFASMLSLRQIEQMLSTPRLSDRDATRRDTLLRYGYSRLSSVLVNLLILGLTLPCFLLREPANLLRQSVLCASLALPATIGSAIGMMMPLPGISPAVGVFLPVIILGFLSLFPWTFFKT